MNCEKCQRPILSHDAPPDILWFFIMTVWVVVGLGIANVIIEGVLATDWSTVLTSATIYLFASISVLLWTQLRRNR